jgi:hypothetical protein
LGCGCGRKKTNRNKRLRKERLKKSSKKISSSKTSVKNKKINICMSCPYTKQTQSEKKRGIKVCHKTNLLTNNIIKNKNFKCPINKF